MPEISMKQVHNGEQKDRHSFVCYVIEGRSNRIEKRTSLIIWFIFFTFSNAQLKQIFNCYHQYSSIDIEEAIKVHIDSSLYYIYMAIGMNNDIIRLFSSI